MRCAILNDYQRISLTSADWSVVDADVELMVFDEHIGDEDAVAAALRDFEIVVLMRERTPFPRSLIERLPALRLIVTTGRWNPSVDVTAAEDRGIVVSHTGSVTYPTAELTWGLILALARRIPGEDRNLRDGGRWQNSVGIDLNGKTLGLLGLGTVGKQVARVGQAFGMRTVAWSRNLTPAACAEEGVAHVDKDALLRDSDVLSVHVQLSRRTVGLIGAAELGRMKRTALLINTSRGFIVDEEALMDAIEQGVIAGAGLDVFEREPLPHGHRLRRLPNTVLTPHLGYVTEDTYRVMYRDVVENIRAWLDGTPLRVLRVEQQVDRSL